MTTTGRQLRFVLPIRTSKRKKEAKSPDQQRDLAFGWAQAHQHEIVAVLDSGKDESGKTMDRETIRRAMEMVRAGEADGIVFALTDRLGRAPIEESMAWIRQLDLVGHLALADAGGDPVNLSDPNAETALVLQLQIARQYWLAAARRFRQSQRDAIRAGKWIGLAPLGFQRGEDKRLHEHPVYGPVIRQAYRIAARDGIHAAVAFLKGRVPERDWDTDHVRRLLASRAYLGENRYVLKEDPGNFPAEELVSPTRHDALTDLATWTAAQTEPQARRSNGDYPLSHQIHCGRCGAGMVGALQTVGERKYRRMRCSAVCEGGCSISADGLEAYMLEALQGYLAPGSPFRDLFTPEDTRDAQAALQAAQANRDALPDVMAPTHPKFAEWLARYDAEIVTAQRAFQEASARANRVENLPPADELHKAEQFARGLRAVLTLGRFIVAPGRGAVRDRVSFIVDDDVTGALAA